MAAWRVGDAEALRAVVGQLLAAQELAEVRARCAEDSLADIEAALTEMESEAGAEAAFWLTEGGDAAKAEQASQLELAVGSVRGSLR